MCSAAIWLNVLRQAAAVLTKKTGFSEWNQIEEIGTCSNTFTVIWAPWEIWNLAGYFQLFWNLHCLNSEHTPDGEPLPEFIGAKPEEVEHLMSSLIETNAIMKEGKLDLVLQAAATAFGFVYVHPFADGNGRLHRCLIHHTLSDRRFTPPGMLFPVSSVMLDWIDKYREMLQVHSSRLMEFIEWEPTAKGNLRVLNDTADLYKYFDCTEAAEFLYSCVKRTIEADLPRAIDYLTRRDEAVREVMNVVEMPDLTAEQFVLFVHRNGGTLPNKRRKSEFAALKDEELAELEKIVRDVFDGFEETPGQICSHLWTTS